MEKPNLKTKLQRNLYLELWIHQRVWFHLKTHKKKSILFGFCAMLDAYYKIHTKVYTKLTSQTLYGRLTKGIHREMYPTSHVICVETKSSLPPDLKNELIDYFLQTEAEIIRGLPRSILVDFALHHHLIPEKDKYINSFYSASGYKQIVKLIQKNQRKSNLTVHEFVHFFEKIHELNPHLNLAELFHQFTLEIEDQITAAKERDLTWLKKVKERNQEHLNKMKNVFKLAEKTELTALDKLERELEEKRLEHELLHMKLQSNPGNSTLTTQLKSLESELKSLEKRRSEEYTRSH